MIDDIKTDTPKPDRWVVFSVAGIWLLVFAGAVVFGMFQKPSGVTAEMAAAQAEQRVAELATGFKVTDLLFVAATNLAEERGLIYTRLLEGSSVMPDMRATILDRRAASDQALDQAVHLAASAIALPNRDRSIEAIEKHRVELEKLRHVVDAWIPDGESRPAARLSSNWFASSSRLIASAERLLVLIHYILRGRDPVVDRSLKLQHLAWTMSEFAARERGLTSGAIAEKRLTRPHTDWTRIAIFRRFNNAWHSARSITSHTEMPSEIHTAMNEIEQGFMRDLNSLRDDLKQFGENRLPNSVTASAWFGASTEAIRPMLRLGRLAGKVARQRSMSPRAHLTETLA